MLDRLFELLAQVWEALLPFVVLAPYEKGILIRLGNPIRDLGPGFHWVAPFHIDVVLQENVVPRTSRLAGLSTTTSDGKSVGFDAVVTWSIASIRKALLEVDHLDDAIQDTCAGCIGTELSNTEWRAIWHGEVTENLTAVCRKRGWKWGVEIHSVQLAGVALVRNLRISGQSGAAPVKSHVTSIHW
jgi:regulator of protease activity HflC (stomatin/prohibitin superfamily)